ncbi:hypothetical protein RRG08_061351 [Elysia crispata]|uniref:Uncharacterized protein n=1 Tax=Elysia crispata TaxID=231223 RepID=A0AAE1AF88_9GAST|nr:hypothetical protein RRG08_061351 [Elysia crispata]
MVSGHLISFGQSKCCSIEEFLTKLFLQRLYLGLRSYRSLQSPLLSLELSVFTVSTSIARVIGLARDVYSSKSHSVLRVASATMRLASLSRYMEEPAPARHSRQRIRFCDDPWLGVSGLYYLYMWWIGERGREARESLSQVIYPGSLSAGQLQEVTSSKLHLVFVTLA